MTANIAKSPAQNGTFIWTLQHRDFLSQNDDTLVIGKDNFNYRNWKHAYGWMESQYRRKIGKFSSSNALIWVWLQERFDEVKLYQTVTMLEPCYHFSLKDKLVIVLRPPRGIVLKSSYNRWNILLDYCLTFKKKPSADVDWQGIFDVRRLGSWDHQQGVIPYVKQSWITSIIELDKSKLKKHGADFRTR